MAFADVNDVYDAIVASGTEQPDFAAYERRKQHRLRVIRWGTEYFSAAHAERTTDRSARLRKFRSLATRNPATWRLLRSVFTGPDTVTEVTWADIDTLRNVAIAT